MLNYLTPHGKWHIHSTYGDNQRMTTLSRGCEPFWMNDRDAGEIGIETTTGSRSTTTTAWW
jgi:nitrate reductase / nitrite oxidoreductase, alpha subunit